MCEVFWCAASGSANGISGDTHGLMTSGGAADALDIGSVERGPGAALSNFARHPFIFRGAQVASMEALLQSLKVPSPELQAALWRLHGPRAKRAGAPFQWVEKQLLYWRGKPLDRHGPDYQALLDEAYEALFVQNEAARAALLATGDLSLTHNIGKTDPRETVLTRQEFCTRLERLRRDLRTSSGRK